MKDEIEDLKEELDHYRNGYKGSCYCCEPVGELNLKLTARLQSAIKRMETIQETHPEISLDEDIRHYKEALAPPPESTASMKLVLVQFEDAVDGDTYITEMKHGWIEGQWDSESKTCAGYYWRDMEWYPHSLWKIVND